MPRRKDNWLGALPPGRFPYANSETLEEAPPVCPKCRGRWRPVEEGYSCMICGTRWRAAALLREMVGRQYRSENRPEIRRPK